MSADKDINDLTYRINGAIFEVSRTLGPGFLEKVYERALLIEYRKQASMLAFWLILDIQKPRPSVSSLAWMNKSPAIISRRNIQKLINQPQTHADGRRKKAEGENAGHDNRKVPVLVMVF